MRIDVQGLDLVEDVLSQLEQNVARKIVRDGVKAGADILRQSASASARGLVGGEMGDALSAAIQVFPWTKQSRGSFGVSIGITSESGWDRMFVYIAKFWSRYKDRRSYIPTAIEYGHLSPANRHVPAIPFMRAGFEMGKDQAEAVTRAVIIEGIKKYVVVNDIVRNAVM